MNQKILIAPLDWGLGHSARCVPLIREHLSAGNDVVLASNGRSASFLRQQFPGLPLWDDIPDYAVTYASSGSFFSHLLRQVPHINMTIRREHEWLHQKMNTHAFDEVISDNRYGLWTHRATTSIITHQLFPIVPFPFNIFASRIVKKMIRRFDMCMVPDYADSGHNLSGQLSHGTTHLNVKYIGPLSRFSPEKNETTHIERDFLVLVSGPEPQRTIFQEKMTKVMRELGTTSLMVCGKPGEFEDTTEGDVRILSHLDDAELKKAIQTSRHIICRSGYSTIMDLHVLGKKAILIPTPGQTEQEYLAKHLETNFGFCSLLQDHISSPVILQKCDQLNSQHFNRKEFV